MLTRTARFIQISCSDDNPIDSHHLLPSTPRPLLKGSQDSISNIPSGPRMAETSEPIAVLILGGVHRTGEGVLKRLVEKGCTVVVGNRAPDPNAARRDGYYAGLINLVDSTELGNHADGIRRQLLGPNKYFNVVIYNGMCIFLAVYVHS